MFFTGLIIGVISFVMIGIFHPIVIKCEYYFSVRIWPLFLLAGLLLCALSIFVENVIVSAGLAVAGFSALWSIGELKHQEKRVQKGWFPANPKRGPHVSPSYIDDSSNKLFTPVRKDVL